MWHSAAKAIYLNLTVEGQLRVESCGSDVVGGRMGPSGTAGTLSGSPGCIMVMVQMRSALVEDLLTAACLFY